MRIVGALSKSNQSSVVYFCSVTLEELEHLACTEPTFHTAKLTADDRGAMLAVISSDEMKQDKNVVGIMFCDRAGFCVTSINMQYDAVREDMMQIFDWEYRQ